MVWVQIWFSEVGDDLGATYNFFYDTLNQVPVYQCFTLEPELEEGLSVSIFHASSISRTYNNSNNISFQLS